MRTPESVVFTRLMLGGLMKVEFREEEHPRDEGGKFSIGPGFGTPKGPIESHTQDELRSFVPKNKKGIQTYKGVNVDLIHSVHRYDPKETGLETLILRNPTDTNPKYMKVYKYTKEHDQIQAEKKFKKAVRMSSLIGSLRDKIDLELKHKDEKTRAAATVAKIIDTTYMRVGGGRTEKDTGSAGATSLKPKHLTDLGSGGIRVKFLGKSGVPWDRTITDPGILRNVREFMKGKGKEDDIFPVDDGDVNEYLKARTKAAGGITAKDFRTFHASSIVHQELAKAIPKSVKEAKVQISDAIEKAAEMLGHTPSVCKSKYVNPAIIALHLKKATGV